MGEIVQFPTDQARNRADADRFEAEVAEIKREARQRSGFNPETLGAETMGHHNVGFSEHGRRTGETHHRAKLEQHDVDLIRDLHEEEGLSYDQLAAKFDVCKNTIAKICRYETWAQSPVEWGPPRTRQHRRRHERQAQAKRRRRRS